MAGCGRPGSVSRQGKSRRSPTEEPESTPSLPLTAAQVEELLSGRPGPAGAEALAAVVAVVSRPGLPHELAGYGQVRRAFESADAGRGGPHSTSTIRRVRQRSAAVKIGSVLAAVTALSVAGIITAAGANKLPTPVQQFVHNVFGGVGVPRPNPGGRVGSSTPGAPAGMPPSPSPSSSVAPSEASTAPSQGRPATGSPSQSDSSGAAADLCNAYEHSTGNGNSNRMAMITPSPRTSAESWHSWRAA
jgi:hypothetical protein